MILKMMQMIAISLSREKEDSVLTVHVFVFVASFIQLSH